MITRAARESARVRGVVSPREPSEPFDGGLLRPERVRAIKAFESSVYHLAIGLAPRCFFALLGPIGIGIYQICLLYTSPSPRDS